MKTIIATLVVLFLLGVNHLIHGPGCWGFQPGGRFSMYLYLLQLICLMSAFVTNIIYMARKQMRNMLRCFFFMLIAIGVAGYFLINQGFVIFSSIHNQGVENVLPFVVASVSTIVISIFLLMNKMKPV